jgi:hypothetical protein
MVTRSEPLKLTLMKRTPSPLLAVLAVFIAAACSTSPPTRPPSPTTTSSERYGAPAVHVPLQVEAVAGDPCHALLARGELELLGFASQGKQRDLVGVRECAWTAADGHSLSLTMDARRDPLVDAYRTPWRGVSKPTTLAGVPALRQKTGAGDLNSCVVTISLGPQQGLTTDWFAEGVPRPGNDACEFAERATAMVIRKLRPQR